VQAASGISIRLSLRARFQCLKYRNGNSQSGHSDRRTWNAISAYDEDNATRNAPSRGKPAIEYVVEEASCSGPDDVLVILGSKRAQSPIISTGSPSLNTHLSRRATPKSSRSSKNLLTSLICTMYSRTTRIASGMLLCAQSNPWVANRLLCSFVTA